MAIFTTLKSRTDDRALLHESVPITGTIVSGTYGDENIKNYTHGMFQSVYDYPYLSSSANHIFDLTNGYATSSAMATKTPASTQNSKKINMYNLHAQQLVGYSPLGSILEFDVSGSTATGGTKMKECIFIDFTRLLVKDEIKKGSFTLKLGVHFSHTGSNQDVLTIQDTGAATDYKVNSPAGEYGILKAASLANATDSAATQLSASAGTNCGLIFYQAGVAVLTSSLFEQRKGGAELGYGFLKTACNFEQFTTGKIVSSFRLVRFLELRNENFPLKTQNKDY